jgi:hypothetical protein
MEPAVNEGDLVFESENVIGAQLQKRHNCRLSERDPIHIRRFHIRRCKKRNGTIMYVLGKVWRAAKGILLRLNHGDNFVIS